jgi:two-component system NtrC family sensor kinase
LKPRLRLKDYGDLPLVDCYPGQLNQVFMNLLVNAIDALEEGIQQGKLAQETPRIQITTAIVSHNQVQIKVADNGPGIAPEVQQNLFQPFFTTKPIGRAPG